MSNEKQIQPYNREKALVYATQWALSRNNKYYDFSGLGGDCTSFASQVLAAGGAQMNYSPTFGWYYISANQKSPSWTGVNFLYDFLTANLNQGPFAEPVDPEMVEPGDIVQLSFSGNGHFGHSLVVTKLLTPPNLENIFVSAHSPNILNQRLPNTYSWNDIRFIHIQGSR